MDQHKGYVPTSFKHLGIQTLADSFCKKSSHINVFSQGFPPRPEQWWTQEPSFPTGPEQEEARSQELTELLGLLKCGGGR
ncbi:hypothetical protein CHARACLAT_022519 [Characodon lateralis]|uniref:Uncharacterized protein n=1 Tax=Characodon lateralis TaxID=208331 RepID=A0ABU7D920_9TELE|nr:hypothetical protein [Characodon lateralis]